TEAVIEPNELGITNPDCHEYAATDYLSFRRILYALDVRAGKDVFLDLGCGMGRALLLAARLPFQRIIGVEISPRLCDDARRNVERMLPKLVCRDIQVVASDAACYVIPPAVSVVYF